MGQHSKIEWCDATWPIVQGCDPVSQGCVNCYAVPLLWRMGHHPDPKISAPVYGLVERYTPRNGDSVLRFTGKLALREDRLTWPLQWKKPRMIFVPSHGDIFHKDVPDEFLDKIFAVMALCPHHTFQVLTKRAERMRQYMTSENRCHVIGDRMMELAEIKGGFKCVPWPFPNVWLGISAERQEEADERIPHLLNTPAAIRFVSAEPLLGPVYLTKYLHDSDCDIQEHGVAGTCTCCEPRESHIKWVIVGGESGQGAREHDLEWSRSIIAQCKAAGVAVFVKQLGARPIGKAGPLFLNDRRKGGDIHEWPEDLRVREFPIVTDGSEVARAPASHDPNREERCS